MAKVNQRLWRIPGQRTKRKAWGFTAQIEGKQVRRYRAEWSRDEAEAELAKALLQIEEQKPKAGEGLSFGAAVERYLNGQVRRKSVKNVIRQLGALKSYFGAETPLEEITSARIGAWKDQRLAAICPSTGRPYSAAAINRPLAALRDLLRLANDEWQLLDGVPRIRMEKEPQGRMRWLEPDEEHRLLDACRASRTKHLANVVSVAVSGRASYSA